MRPPPPEMVVVEDSERDARRKVLVAAMAGLNERERAILMARRLADPPQTLEELAQEHDVSRERIRQIETRAFEKLTQSDDGKRDDGLVIEAALIDGEVALRAAKG